MSIWTTLEDETALITTLEATGRLATSVVGESAGGTDIVAWRIGGDVNGPPSLADPATLLFVGLQHGDEPAGREALLAFADYLCNTVVVAETDFLDAHGVLMIPTVNPDGFPDRRTNGDSDDINRFHLSLDVPEVRAVASVLATTTPLVVIDHHEFGPGFATEDILFADPSHPATYSGIVTTSDDLITALETRAAAEPWTFADYPTSGPPEQGASQRLVANAGLRHSVAVLIESRETADDDPGQQARVDIHYAMAEEVLAYCITNQATLATGQTTARDAKAAEGAAGVTPFELGGGVTIDPPPLGYLMLGVPPALHINLFNIDLVNGSTISMEQAAQPVIPLLLDQDSTEAVASGNRLFALPDPIPPATVAEFAAVVYGSHRMVVEARVLTMFQVGDNPAGTDIGVVSGDVMMDATAEVFASVTMETEGVDERGRSRFPRRASDLLAPYGNELFIRRGVDIGSAVLWSPLGYFRIDDAEQSPASDSPIRLSGQDRMAGIIDARVVEPFVFPATRTFGHVIDRLVTQVYPDAVIAFDDDSSEDQIGRQIVVEESRYDALLDVAESLAKVIYFDGQGILRIEDPPTAAVPVWDVKAGHNGVLVESGRVVSREGMRNGFVARGEGGDTQVPVQAIVVDTGANSPTRWTTAGDPEARFGRVPGFSSSPLLTTQAQCRQAAESLLRRHIGMPYSANFGTVVNPALRPNDPIRVTQKDGNRELHIVETVTIPLTASAHMTGTTREQTSVAIGALDTIGEL